MGRQVGSYKENIAKDTQGRRNGFTSSWWVVLFIACCSFYHMHSLHKKNQTYAYLQNRIQELEEQKSYAQQKKEELLMEIYSQQDPSWVEMVLIKGLGVIPEGTRKVFFTEE